MGTILYFILLTLFLVTYLPIFALIWLVTLPFDPKKKCLFRASQFLSWTIVRLCPLWKVVVEGKENIRKGQTYIVMCNHQSMLDIPLLVAMIPFNSKWVAKKEVYYIPVFGMVLWMRDDVAIERGGLASTKKMLKKCIHFINKGISIFIFPEGTRSKTGRVDKFKEGGFITAKMSSVPILPIVMDGTWGISNHPGFGLKMPTKLIVRILPEISAEEIKKTSAKDLTVKLHDIILEEHMKIAPWQYKDHTTEEV